LCKVAGEDAPPSDSIVAAIEGGGTKFVCAVGYSAQRVLERVVIPTTAPGTTLEAMLTFFDACQIEHGAISAVGLATFGPLDLRRGSPTFGRLMATPKPGWSGADLLGPLLQRYNVPVAINTDVTAAALAELELGVGLDVGSLAYVTVGTGIGCGFAPDVWRGAQLLHPEIGHLRVRRDPRDLDFAGVCPFHGDCLEGLASGPAIRARWGDELSALDATHPAWSIIGSYLGQLAVSIALVASPQRIVLGGGVMTGGRLLPLIRAATRDFLNGYIEPLNDSAALHRYICSPALSDQAGLAGAFLMATQAKT
jgi:fructokinase